MFSQKLSQRIQLGILKKATKIELREIMKTTFSRNHMVGKVYLVTGATAEFGNFTATALDTQGADVIFPRRKQQKTLPT
jgi:NADP-dependent 3-hydroxy acid dehydrogenase YdfG